MSVKLIVGLGNPGKKYEKTRHNFGFAALDELARSLKADFLPSSFKGELAIASHPVHDKIFLLKPQTYMNLSGESAAPLAHFYKIAPADILVLFDDLDLPLGRMRFAAKGSAGGHNGIKSLIGHLGTADFPRLKLGIGRPTHPGFEVVDYVLQKFSKEESVVAEKVLQTAAEAIQYLLAGNDLTRAANRYNGVAL